MKPPIILRDKQAGDAMVFESVDDVLSYVESVDVQDGVYEVFDSDGRLLEFEILEDHKEPGKRQHRLDNLPMALRAAETSPRHAAEVKRHLTDTLVLSGESESKLRSLSLEELVGLARSILRPR